MLTDLPQVPLLRDSPEAPKSFQAPPKEEVQDLSSWDYINKVWDVDERCTRIHWRHGPQGPPTIEACIQHMVSLDKDYGGWL